MGLGWKGAIIPVPEAARDPKTKVCFYSFGRVLVQGFSLGLWIWGWGRLFRMDGFGDLKGLGLSGFTVYESGLDVQKAACVTFRAFRV